MSRPVDLRIPFVMLAIILGIVLLSLAATFVSSTPKTVLIGRTAFVYHAPASGGGIPSGWTVPSHFYRPSINHKTKCGRRISPEIRGKRGVYRMYFRRCFMTEGPVSVYPYPKAPPRPGTTPTSTALPRPTATSAPVAAGPPPPVYAPPTATPWVAPPSAYPTATAPPAIVQSPPSDPVLYELFLMNRTRASLGLPAYTLNSTQSTGTASCVGSYGHALHMSAVGYISHDQFPADICVATTSAGENVGMAGGYSVSGSLDIVHQQMMMEQHDASYCAQLAQQNSGNHACSIISLRYRQVGIGVVMVGSSTYMAVDFLG